MPQKEEKWGPELLEKNEGLCKLKTDEAWVCWYMRITLGWSHLVLLHPETAGVWWERKTSLESRAGDKWEGKQKRKDWWVKVIPTVKNISQQSHFVRRSISTTPLKSQPKTHNKTEKLLESSESKSNLWPGVKTIYMHKSPAGISVSLCLLEIETAGSLTHTGP